MAEMTICHKALNIFIKQYKQRTKQESILLSENRVKQCFDRTSSYSPCCERQVSIGRILTQGRTLVQYVQRMDTFT